MGCDIHLYVERRVNGVWESADTWTLSTEQTNQPYYEVSARHRYFQERNYYLFYALALGRNRYVIPIAEPRGLPDDVSEQVRTQTGISCFKHSWLTLAELFEYDWTALVPQRGVLMATDFAEWMTDFPEKSSPPYKQLSLGEILRLSGEIRLGEAEMTTLIQSIFPAFPESKLTPRELENLISIHFPNHYVICAWEQPLHTLASGFWSDTIPRLLRLGKSEDVRIVFWFE